MRIAILKKDKCQPRKCEYECIKYCPMVRTGVETVVLGDDSKPIISEDLCEGCGICIKKCPFGAISIIGLPEELKGKETHRYGENGFVLYGLPIPKAGKITGTLGANGTGKSTAIKILAGLQVPNLGKVESEASWDAVIKRYAGSELQNYFDKVSNGKIKVAYKPQYVDAIPKLFDGKVHELLESTDETGVLKQLVGAFELEEAMDKDINALSGGELQRVAVIGCIARDADFYFFHAAISLFGSNSLGASKWTDFTILNCLLKSALSSFSVKKWCGRSPSTLSVFILVFGSISVPVRYFGWFVEMATKNRNPPFLNILPISDIATFISAIVPC